MTRDDYVDLVERRYFGNVTRADIPAVVACFTDDAAVTIYHGDAAPRVFKAAPAAGETALPRFFEHLLANYEPRFTEFVHYVDEANERCAATFPRHADAEAGLLLSRGRRAAAPQLQLLPLPGRAHPRDDHLLQQPRHRVRRGRPRLPPHRLPPGVRTHQAAVHGVRRPCQHRAMRHEGERGAALGGRDGGAGDRIAHSSGSIPANPTKKECFPRHSSPRAASFRPARRPPRDARVADAQARRYSRPADAACRAVRPPERRNGRSPSANGRGAVEVRERSLQSEPASSTQDGEKARNPQGSRRTTCGME